MLMEVIKIIQLLPSSVASFHVRDSLSPEIEARQKMDAWAKKLNIFDNPTVFQVYGFNNPFPGTDELRGYEFWITIPENFNTGNNMVKHYSGGLYAVIRIRGVQNIMDWVGKLYHWLKANPNYELGYPPNYDFKNGPSLELEHILNPAVTNEEEILIDYHLPVKTRNPSG
jgi:DNA gyrase inhibitor GyrI